MTITGQSQGDIKGSVTTKGHEDSIEVYSYTHSIVVPRDPATGQATGKRQHKPLTITKPLDKSTPLLYHALTTSETLREWKLDFFRIQNTGTLELFFTIELSNALITDITSRGSIYGSTESISFVYQKITWIWADGGITAEDDLRTSAV